MFINNQMKMSSNIKHMEASVSDAEEVYVRDYKSLDLTDIKSFFKDEYLETTAVNVNDLIEVISNNIYEDPNMWDLLLIINNKNALYDMPVDNDHLNDIKNEIVNQYFFNLDTPYQGPIDEEFIELYKENFFNKLNQENFEKQKIKFLKPEYLTDFFKKVKYKD